MIQINKLREFLDETKTEIDEINFVELVVDDSELEKFMKDQTSDENTMLFAVVPDFNTQGSDDAIKWNNKLLFFVVEKINEQDLDHSEYLDVFDRTQSVMRKFVTSVVEKKSNQELMCCSILREMDESSITVEPVWRKCECNGWVITFDLLSMF